MTHSKDQWGSKIGLVLAMAGNAVGFGNFLRFPIQAIQNGGGAFIIPYLVCFVFLGLPLVFVEWTMGRFGGSYGNHTVPFTMEKLGKGRIWKYFGAISFFTTIGIASYYCYLESWTISYLYHSLLGTFHGMSQGEIAQFFTDYHDRSSTHSGLAYENVIIFLLCIVLNVYILCKGLKGGIEKVATFGIPLLIFFGFFLAVRGVMIQPGEEGAVASGISGLDFLWTPQFQSLTDPKVWLAAAGQIFFTLSVGMGTIQCYASYVKKNDDIALNAFSTSFVNEFVEIVLGGTILISISVGFFGIDAVKDLVANEGGFGIAFQSMPFLFQKFGVIMGTLCGVAFFGLLFIAGVTSSLAMGTPLVSFLQDEYHLKKRHAAMFFGLAILIFGLPTVLFFREGVFDEYDYWAGTVGVFTFAMLQIILFSWVYGADKGWKEFNRASTIKVPGFFRLIIKYITPIMLIVIFVAALIQPANGDWKSAFTEGWSFDGSSVIGRMMGKGARENGIYTAMARYFLITIFISGMVLVFFASKKRRSHSKHTSKSK